MVGPSITDEERERFSRRLKVGFVVMVAFSGALVAVYAGGNALLVAGGAAAGAVVGAVLVWYLSWIGTGAVTGNRRRGR